MSSEEVGDNPEGKGEIFESSAAESVAEGVEGKGANKRQVPSCNQVIFSFREF